MDKRRQMLTSIRERNVQRVQELLDTGLDLNKGSDPPLCVAMEVGDREIAELLLKSGAHVQVSSSSEYFPLHLAAKYGHLDLLKILLSNGADLNQLTGCNDNALYLATANEHTEIAAHLVDSGSVVDHTASFLYSGNTALHKAATLSSPDILNILLRANANINMKNDERQIPLHLAAAAGRTENVRRLLECDSLRDEVDSLGNTPLSLATIKGHSHVARELCRAGAKLNFVNTAGYRCLEVAASEGHLQVARVLLHFGADVNQASQVIQRTPLHLAIVRCSHKMKDVWNPKRKKATLNLEIEMLDTLMQAGAKLDTLDGKGDTPLHLCIKEGCAPVLEYLLNSGADYMKVNGHEQTVLYRACSDNVPQAVKLLVQLCPALLSHPRNHASLKSSPLYHLVQKQNLSLVQLLVEAGYSCSRVEQESILDQNGLVSAGIKKYIEVEMSHPWPLQRACRTRIRELLNKQLSGKVFKLPIPQKLRDALLLQNNGVVI